MKPFMRYLLVAAGLALAGQAQAVLVGFSCISGGANCATGEAQFAVDVQAVGATQVSFTFTNNVGLASSITDVYFDDGSLLGIASITDSGAGVAFSNVGVAPPNLPGGNNASPPFVTTAGFSADSDNPPPQNGVNTNLESVTILFDLIAGQTFADTIAALTNGDLRIGIHGQAFGDGGSESFVNVPVPIPAAVWLLGSGLIALIGIGRRNRRVAALAA